MTKPRLKTLKPRIQTLSTSRVQTLTARPEATPRLRGRKWMECRESWLRLHPLCCDCEAEGVTKVAEEVDHIIPLWKGGADDESNYASRCKDHHAAKTAQEAKERGNASPWGS